MLESLVSDGVLISKKYKNMFEFDQSNVPTDIQLLLNNSVISEKGLTANTISNEIAGPASNTFPTSMITTDDTEFGSKLYRPTNRNVIRFAPPLVINKTEIKQAIAIIKSTLIKFDNKY